MKQAYLIISHNKIEQLKFLISLLDYEKNDIFILFDKKSNITKEDKNEIKRSAFKSKIIFVNEVPIFSGDYSLVKAELELFKAAKSHDKYSFYHLLSGMYLPLDNAIYIYNFFDKKREYNFMQVVSDEFSEKMRRSKRVKFYRLFPKLNHRTVNFKVVGYLIAVYRKFEKLVQRILKVNRISKYNIKIKRRTLYRGVVYRCTLS